VSVTLVDTIEACASKGCKSAFNGNPGVAVVEVLWPGQALKMCQPCADRAKGVAEAMGFPLEVRPLAIRLEGGE
jgi:hypothetical protein